MFFIKTIDYIADPNFPTRKIPLELFEIGEMLSSKIKNSKSEEFIQLLRYAFGLKEHPKYEIKM